MALTIVASALPVLPDEISYGFPGGPEYVNDVVVLESRNEQRNNYSPEPFFSWDIGYLMKTETEAYILRNFFHSCRGRWRPFRMKDWEDYKSCAADAEIDFDDQSLGAATAGQTQFQLIKTYSAGGYGTTLTIYKPRGSTVRVGIDGVEETSGWTVDEDTGIITRAVALTGGEAVTWGGEWYHKVRFDLDKFPLTPEGYTIGSVQVPVIAIP